MNKQQLESILNNAPEGATHYDRGDDNRYYRFVKLISRGAFEIWSNYCEDWDMIDFIAQDVSRISDLQTQLNQLNEIDELEKENAELKAKIQSDKDLEEEIDNYERMKMYIRG